MSQEHHKRWAELSESRAR